MVDYNQLLEFALKDRDAKIKEVLKSVCFSESTGLISEYGEEGINYLWEHITENDCDTIIDECKQVAYKKKADGLAEHCKALALGMAEGKTKDIFAKLQESFFKAKEKSEIRVVANSPLVVETTHGKVEIAEGQAIRLFADSSDDVCAVVKNDVKQSDGTIKKESVFLRILSNPLLEEFLEDTTFESDLAEPAVEFADFDDLLFVKGLSPDEIVAKLKAGELRMKGAPVALDKKPEETSEPAPESPAQVECVFRKITRNTTLAEKIRALSRLERQEIVLENNLVVEANKIGKKPVVKTNVVFESNAGKVKKILETTITTTVDKAEAEDLEKELTKKGAEHVYDAESGTFTYEKDSDADQHIKAILGVSESVDAVCRKANFEKPLRFTDIGDEKVKGGKGLRPGQQFVAKILADAEKSVKDREKEIAKELGGETLKTEAVGASVNVLVDANAKDDAEKKLKESGMQYFLLKGGNGFKTYPRNEAELKLLSRIGTVDTHVYEKTLSEAELRDKLEVGANVSVEKLDNGEEVKTEFVPVYDRQGNVVHKATPEEISKLTIEKDVMRTGGDVLLYMDYDDGASFTGEPYDVPSIVVSMTSFQARGEKGDQSGDWQWFKPATWQEFEQLAPQIKAHIRSINTGASADRKQPLEVVEYLSGILSGMGFDTEEGFGEKPLNFEWSKGRETRDYSDEEKASFKDLADSVKHVLPDDISFKLTENLFVAKKADKIVAFVENRTIGRNRGIFTNRVLKAVKSLLQ